MSFLSSEKKKKKRHLLAPSETKLDESYIDTIEGKKKKKKKVKSNDDQVTSLVEGKKQNKASMNSSLVPDVNGISKAKKKNKEDKKRKVSLNKLPDEGLSSAFEESPKKKKKKSKKNEYSILDDEQVLKSEDSLLDEELVLKSQKTPKKSKSVLKETNLTPKSSKKTKETSIKSPHMKGGSGSKHKPGLSSGKKIPKTEEESDSIGNLSQWSRKEELALIDKIRSNLNPEDTSPFRTSIRNIKWEEIALENRSPSECSQILEKLIHKITKIKSLGMILQEVIEGVPSTSRLGQGMSAQDRFIHDYCKTHKSELSATELRTVASGAWSVLSDEEKQKYELEYGRQLQVSQQAMTLPGTPRKVFDIFYSEQVRKGTSKGSFEFRNTCSKMFYTGMAMEKKAKYMGESCKEWAKYISEFDSHIKSHPESKVKISNLTSKDLFKTYFEYIGMPLPPPNVVNILRQDLKKKGKLLQTTAQEQLIVVGQMYKNLSVEEKERYVLKKQDLKDSFDELYKTWKASVGEEIALVAETYFVKSSSEKSSSKGPKGKGITEIFTNIYKVSMAKPKFPDEPERPPQNAQKIFSLKFEKRRKDKYKSVKEMRKACTGAWKGLSSEAKSLYEERDKENKVAFKLNLLPYVKSLGDVDKVFLGFKRKEFFTYFKEDIFEKDFPHKDYPIYLIERKEVGKLEKVIKLEDPFPDPSSGSKNSSDEDDSVDDEEEEEEEEEGESDSATMQQHKTPVKEIKHCVEEQEEETSEDEVLEAWQTPQRIAQNNEKDSDDEDDDSSEGEDEEDDSSDDDFLT